MPQEIEAKIRISDFAEVRRRLRAARAKQVKTTLELNVFFDTPDQALRKADKGVRIRRNHDLRTCRDEIVATFKGPRKKGKLKSREECEVVVSDFDAAADLLEHLGFHRTISFEKRRESWLVGGCKVELDELPQLGRYVEVEGPSRKVIHAVLKKLELSLSDMVTDSYANLVASHLRSAKAARYQLRFNK